jgi:ribonucleoside-diphosphate reductase alpha chain
LLGSFPTYDKNKMLKSEFMKRLYDSNLLTDSDLEYQYCVACNTVAPVGSGSIVANVGGSGIEPIFSKYYVRRERSTTSEWKEWFTFNAYVERYLKEHGLEVTKENADELNDDYWIMSYDVDNFQKIKLVSEAQKWIDSSISVTFNLPEEATVEDVKKIYIDAWKHELKGVTIYREGSLAGVMITEKNYNKVKKEEEGKIKEKYKGDNYIKRPDELPCDIYEAKYKDDKFVILVGLHNNEPYEVFVTPNNNNEVDVEKYKKGFIKKVKSNHYNLIVENGITKTMVNNIGSTFDSLYGTVSRMVSMSLRHGVSLHFIIDQLNKDSGFIAFEKVLSRVLKKYIKDNTNTKKKCPDCGGDLIYTNGCVGCSNSECSYSKCE